MSFIVYRTDKNSGSKYAYYTESYRDPVTKQPKSRKTYLGRVDPVTGKIVPKAEKGRRNHSKLGNQSAALAPDLAALLNRQKDEIKELQDELSEVKKENAAQKEKLIEMRDMLNELIGV